MKLLLNILVFLSSLTLFKKLFITRKKIISNLDPEQNEYKRHEEEQKEDLEKSEKEDEDVKIESLKEEQEEHDNDEDDNKKGKPLHKLPDRTPEDLEKNKFISEKFKELKTQEKSHARHVSPAVRGGRPRELESETKINKVKSSKISQPKIDLVCWKEGFSWIIGIDVSDCPDDFQLFQSGEFLEPESDSKSMYQLMNLMGQVKAEWNGGDKTIYLLNQEKEFLIFKMRKNWNELGRLVPKPKSGFYIVVAPKDWVRDPNLAGDAPIEPEQINNANYNAHFFHLKENDDNNLIAFTTLDNSSIKIMPGGPGFQLKGELIEDASDKMGPIFAKKPPVLCASNIEWKDVGLIVVGKEGLGRNRWRTSFVPKENEAEQIFPDELVKKNGGWFFVRIYDNNENLLESLDFRFLKSLQKLEISLYKNLPGVNGHEAALITFYHEEGTDIQLAKGSDNEVKILKSSFETEITIPSYPSWDVSDWKLKFAKTYIEIEIMIERIWWSFVEDESKEESIIKAIFTDKFLNVGRESFSPLSDKAICVWFPQPKWINEIHVGLDESRKRKYPVRISERKVFLPLRDFYDEIRNTKQEAEIKIWITRFDGFQDSIKICHIVQKEQEEKIKTIPEREEISININHLACCNTCDHARKQYVPIAKHVICWCRRFRWPRRIENDYIKKYSKIRCSEWRGEYYDIKRNEWTDKIEPGH